MRRAQKLFQTNHGRPIIAQFKFYSNTKTVYAEYIPSGNYVRAARDNLIIRLVVKGLRTRRVYQRETRAPRRAHKIRYGR